MKQILCVGTLIFGFLSAATVVAKDSRIGKIWPFKIVSFPNEPCQGNTRNGTCYSPNECNDKGGTASGSCAEGYGVCCLFSIGCGATSSENCTYIEETEVTSLSAPCTYTICPCTTSVCRIRFDFEDFTLAGPQTGTTSDNAPASSNGDAIGDCITDRFSITGGIGTPVICGVNAGQHMWVDASQSCHKANFHVGLGSTLNRSWRIKVTQYDCGLNEIAGPPGCLQYHTSNTGTIQSFNFPTGNTVGATTTHLSNQNYEICFRRNNNYCAICYTVAISGANTPGDQGSFGLSETQDTAGQADNTLEALVQQENQACDEDFVVIPNAVSSAAIALTASTQGSIRICGRYFRTTIGTGSAEVCSGHTPFRIGFITNGGESTTNTNDPTTNEQEGAPGGIIGFKLNYVQQMCA